MTRKLFLIPALILFMAGSVFSQSDLNISIGGGYLTTLGHSEKLMYWGNGYSIDLALEYILGHNFAVTVSSSYRNFSYDANSLELASPDVLGYRMQVNGESTKAYELSFNSRYYLSLTSIAHPFVSLGTGIVAINQGNIILTQWTEGNEANKNSGSIAGSNESYLYGQISIGPGCEFQIYKNVNMIVEARFVSGLKGGVSYIPITASFKYGL